MQKTVLGLIFVFVICLPTITHGANIVFYFAVSSYSHRIAVWPLVQKLADLGHNVTFLQPYAPKNPHPKVYEFIPAKVATLMKESEKTFNNLLTVRLEKGKFGTQKEALILPFVGVALCEAYLSSPEYKTWAKTAKVDLVIYDGLFNDCGLGIAHKLGAKTIIFATSTVFSWWFDEFGIPAETSWLPELHVSFPYPMNYLQRMTITLFTVALHLGRSLIYFPNLEKVLREELDMPNMPPVSELMKKVNLILMNSHASEDFARSLPALIVPIGGMHLDVQGKKNEIPKDIASFIDGTGENGFMYVSFGSAANVATAPEDLRNIFYTAFSNSKTRFVWKWDGPRPKEMPPNVITAEWMPQKELLAHPKIKAFISHGGLLSTQEAIVNEVPMITFPLFAEQDYNAYRIERAGRGIRLDISELTLPILQGAISEIIKNTSYKETMKKTKAIFNDRPDKPLDTAIWWVNYVLRHKDTSHLLPLAAHQTWYQRRLLDVWLGVVIVFLLIIFVIKKTLGFLLKLVWPTSNNSKIPPKLSGKKVKKT